MTPDVPAPIVVLSLDGGSFEALGPLVAAGDMPVLGRLLARGAHGTLRSTIPPITPVAWASFLTGKRPGKHGIWDFRVYDPRSYRDVFVSSRALRDPTVLTLLTAAGRRVGVVNLPLMYPPPDGSGTIVAGFDAPSATAVFTRPPELAARIRSALPDFVFVATLEGGGAADDDARFARFLAAAERSVEQRARVANMLLDDGPYDVFCVHLQDTDALQHKLWPDLVVPPRRPERRERLRGTYRLLDARLGDVLARFPHDARVLVVSDHGFGVHRGRVYPNVLLRRWGFLAQPGRWRARLRRSIRKRLGRDRSARLEDGWETRVRERDFGAALPVRWRATRAYVAVAEIYGLVYLNLRGREPEGVVAPGADAEALLAELEARFRAVRDPHGGGPVFQDVLRGDVLDPIDRHGRRPDLVLVPRADLTVGRDLNDRLWLERYPEPMGTHRPEGILVLAGPGIRPGPLPAPVDLVDLAPTILAMADVPVPEDVDGRVLDECFQPPLRVRRVTGDPPVPGGPPEGLSAEDEADVAERLRALGYLA